MLAHELVACLFTVLDHLVFATSQPVLSCLRCRRTEDVSWWRALGVCGCSAGPASPNCHHIVETATLMTAAAIPTHMTFNRHLKNTHECKHVKRWCEACFSNDDHPNTVWIWCLLNLSHCQESYLYMRTPYGSIKKSISKEEKRLYITVTPRLSRLSVDDLFKFFKAAGLWLFLSG